MENQRRIEDLCIEIKRQNLEQNKSAEIRQQKFEEMFSSYLAKTGKIVPAIKSRSEC